MSLDAGATSIYGTLSNFDVYNETPEPCEGFEIELEDVHAADIYRTFPAHFQVENIVDFTEGARTGVRIFYKDYYFKESNGTEHFSIDPTLNPQSTNGHFAVNRADIEHFGFSLRNSQPTATRTYWLDKQADGSYTRANTDPLPIPITNWSIAPNPGVNGRAVVQAQIEVPEREVIIQKPDSIWMKIYKTEIDRAVDLDELMSGPGSIVPQDVGEMEVEWELLEGGKADAKEGEINEDGHAVIKRYEYFKYTGPYDVEHEPLTPFLDDDTLDPVALGHVGNFIAANMEAVNLVPLIVPGDTDGDGDIDDSDLGTAFANYTGPVGNAGGKAGAQGDTDEDGDVDDSDLGTAFANYTGPLGPNNVPEPGSLIALAGASLIALRRRR